MIPLRSLSQSVSRKAERYLKADISYLVRGNIWLSVGRIFAVCSGILLTYTFARFLTVEEFGTYKYILAGASIFGAFSLSGLGNALAWTVARGNKHLFPHMVRIAALWSLPGAVIGIGTSAYYLYQGNPTIGIGFLAAALSIPIVSGTGLAKNYFVGNGDFKTMVLCGMPSVLVTVVSMLIVLFLHGSMIVLLITYFASNVIPNVLLVLFIIKKYKIHAATTGLEEAVVYGKHFSVTGFLSQISAYIDQILLWHFIGPAQVAIYAIAAAPTRELKTLTANVFALMFPRYATRTADELRESIPLRAMQMFIASCLVVAVYIFLAPLFFEWFFPRYMSSVFYSQLLALTLLFEPKGIIEVFLNTQNEVKKRYQAVISSQVARLILLAILVPLYGIAGAVAAFLASDAIQALAFYIAYKNR